MFVNGEMLVLCAGIACFMQGEMTCFMRGEVVSYEVQKDLKHGRIRQMSTGRQVSKGKVAAGAAAALAGAGFVTYLYKEYKKNFLVRGAEPTGFLEFYQKRHPEMEMPEFSCPSVKKGVNLKGLILLPKEEPQALIVMTHGYNFTIENYLPLGRRFTKAGFAVLLFDGIGCGMSEGRYIYGVPQHAIDMKSVLDYVAKDPKLSSLPLLLFGHSWAGHAAAAVPCLGSYPIRGIITCSAPRTPVSAMNMSIRRNYGKMAPLVERISDAMVYSVYGEKAFLRTEEGLRRASCPAQIYHSRDDKLVDYKECFLDLQEALADCPQIIFVGVDGRGHDVYLVPENSHRQREIRKLLKTEEDEARKQELTQELWQLMCKTDEELAIRFIEFYKECLR